MVADPHQCNHQVNTLVCAPRKQMSTVDLGAHGTTHFHPEENPGSRMNGTQRE
jgi:hypothetical protein